MKLKPLWSKWKLRAAAIVCGLFVLNAPSTVWAAGKKASAKPTAGRHAASRHGKKATQRSPRRRVPAEEFGAADVLDGSATGLHGHASFYGQGFEGRKTSTGDVFDAKLFTGASNRFPLGTVVAVRRVDNDRCAIVKLNDRMHPKHRKRIIDVSRGVAEYLDMIRAGVVLVRVIPLPGGKAGRGNESCHAAFAPVPECVSCGQPEKLPDFQGGMGG